MLKPMRKLTDLIEVTVNGHIEDPAYISEFKDLEDQHTPPNMYDLGHVCEIVGQRIKIEGPPSEVGLWMVPVADPTKRKKIERIIRNDPSHIEFVTVDTGFADNRLEIRTQFTGSGTPLHTPRTIVSNFTISRV